MAVLWPCMLLVVAAVCQASLALNSGSARQKRETGVTSSDALDNITSTLTPDQNTDLIPTNLGSSPSHSAELQTLTTAQLFPSGTSVQANDISSTTTRTPFLPQSSHAGTTPKILTFTSRAASSSPGTTAPPPPPTSTPPSGRVHQDAGTSSHEQTTLAPTPPATPEVTYGTGLSLPGQDAVTTETSLQANHGGCSAEEQNSASGALLETQIQLLKSNPAYIGPVSDVLLEYNGSSLRELICSIPPGKTAELVMLLPADVTGALLGKLPADVIVQVTSALNASQKADLVAGLPPATVVQLATILPSQEVGNILSLLEVDVKVKLIDALNVTELLILLGVIPQDSIASLIISLPTDELVLLLSRLPPETVVNITSLLQPDQLAELVSTRIPAKVLNIVAALPVQARGHLLMTLPFNTLLNLTEALSDPEVATLLENFKVSDIASLLMSLNGTDGVSLVSAVPPSVVAGLISELPGDLVQTLIPQLDNFTLNKIAKELLPAQAISLLTRLSEAEVRQLLAQLPVDDILNLLANATGPQVSSILQQVPNDIVWGIVSSLSEDRIVDLAQNFPAENLGRLLLTLRSSQLSPLLNRISKNDTIAIMFRLPPQCLGNLTKLLSKDDVERLVMSLTIVQTSELIHRLPADGLSVLVTKLSDDLMRDVTLSLPEDALADVVTKLPGGDVSRLIQRLDNATQLVFKLPLGTVLNLIGKIDSGVIASLLPDLLQQMSHGQGVSLDLGSLLSPDVLQSLMGAVDISTVMGIVKQILPVLPTMLSGAVESFAQLPVIRNNSELSICLSDIQYFVFHLAKMEDWALRMVDAYGKPGRGILEGNTHMLGNFDQCLAISHAISNGTNNTRVIKGQNCGIEVGLPQDLLPPIPGKGILPEPVVDIYVCLPSSCQARDLQRLFSSLGPLPLNLTIPRVSCQQEDDISEDASAIAAISVLAFLGLLLLAGSAYDVYHNSGEDTSAHPSFDTGAAATNGGFELKENGTVNVGDEGITSFSSKNGGHELMPKEDDESNSEEEEGSRLCRAMLAFSLLRNTERVTSVEVRPDCITCLHGIKVLCMGWLILGYTMYLMALYFENSLQAARALQGIVGQVVTQSTLATDAFFVVSGCLTAYLFVREAIAEVGVKAKNVFYYFVHRFIRLTPAYAITIMALTCLLPYVSDGPTWTRESRDYYSSCQKYWWTNLLYINNFYKSLSDQCMPWSWFLSLDMQLHWLVAPLIVIPLAAGTVSKSACHAIIPGILISGLVALQIFLTVYLEDDINGDYLRHSDQYLWGIFQKPYCRVAPYVMGLGLGYALARTNGRRSMSKAGRAVAWFFVLAAAFAATFVKYNENHVMMDDPFHWSHGARAAHEAVFRPAFSLAVSVAIFLCATGNGGFVNSVLSWRGFVPFSRLTYCTILLFPAVVMADQWQSRVTVFFTISYAAQRAAGYFLISTIFAYFLSVSVEEPIKALGSVIFKRTRVPLVTEL